MKAADDEGNRGPTPVMNRATRCSSFNPLEPSASGDRPVIQSPGAPNRWAVGIVASLVMNPAGTHP